MWHLWTKNEGSKILMKDYQKVIVNRLIDSDYFLTTGEMYELVKDELGEKAISRTSVILFMNDLHEWGYAQMEKGTGKGGVHSKYNITLTKEQLIVMISTKIHISLIEAFEDIFPEQELSFLSFSVQLNS